MSKRKLLDETIAHDLDENITLKIYTKCPSKYKLVDLETGEEYVGQDPRYHNHHWKRL